MTIKCLFRFIAQISVCYELEFEQLDLETFETKRIRRNVPDELENVHRIVFRNIIRDDKNSKWPFSKLYLNLLKPLPTRNIWY